MNKIVNTFLQGKMSIKKKMFTKVFTKVFIKMIKN
jgi:hypothetical protein